MVGHKPFSELRDKMPAESRARVTQRVNEALAETARADVSASASVTPENSLDVLTDKQAALSCLEVCLEM